MYTKILKMDTKDPLFVTFEKYETHIYTIITKSISKPILKSLGSIHNLALRPQY